MTCSGRLFYIVRPFYRHKGEKGGIAYGHVIGFPCILFPRKGCTA
jgi:hypothetical protein